MRRRKDMTRAQAAVAASTAPQHGTKGVRTHAEKDAMTHEQSMRFYGAWGERGVELFLVGMVMTVYVRTLYPSVAGGDSGELVAESCHLGVSHPPGYPLFNMLVYAVTALLPIQRSKAWKANLFSAGCDALAVLFMYRSILLWSSSKSLHARKTAAFTASAMFAFSPLIWTYALGAEVFALNNLFAAALVHVLLQYSINRTLTKALQGAFLCGLALCNQHTIILFEIPIVLWVFWTRRSTLLWKELGLLASAFFVGLLPYAYMPIVANWNPQAGSWGDVSTIFGFIHHLRRADYGTFKLFSTNAATEGLWTRLQLYAKDLSSREVPFHLVAPLAAIGLISTLSGRFFTSTSITKRSLDASTNNIGSLIGTTYVFYVVVFHSLANLPLSEGLTYGVHMRFWQQPNVIVFLWIGIGLSRLLDLVFRHLGHVAGLTGSVLTIGLVVVQLWTWYEFCDQSNGWYIHNYAAALIDPLPQHAVLFVNFDLQWTALRYLQRCEGRRSDVTVLNLSMMTYQWFETKHSLYPSLSFPGPRLISYGSSREGFTFADFLDSNQRKMKRSRMSGGIFFGGKLNYNDQDFHAKYTFVPFGLLDEIKPTTAKPPKLATWYSSQQPVGQLVKQRLPELPKLAKYDDQTWEWTIARDHGMKSLSWSTYLLERTIAEDPHNLALLSESTHAMEQSYQFEPRQFWSPAATLKNLGLAYAQIVKSKMEFGIDASDPFFNDRVGDGVKDPKKYKDRASARMLEVWNAWIQVPEARQDPGFEAIRGVVRQFLPDTQTPKENTQRATGSRPKKTKKTKVSKSKLSREKEPRKSSASGFGAASP
ncbi:hypothetical protein Poli38472_008169 [Pythium oligandrum]|uniref:DUF2723 domain-containing protein n=1 Tax=Pythium oligandrum TaxID=41045 RepID=A0A8K1CL83_PYTOL|nr:hypothetical protein Poli38472_008169 [Pythium oligandrum]|eukprot:TMW65527.1 hypothetical protein Poli38472_008169 [Pythium oligandrum]